MDRDGVGQLQLAELFNAVDRPPPVVKGQLQHFPGGVDLLNPAHVAVEDAAAHGAVLSLPDDVVVVPGLHNPVPLPEEAFSPQKLPLVRRFGIQRLLEAAVEADGAAGPLAHGGEDLNLVRRNAHAPRQAGLAQLHHGGDRPLRLPAAEEEEVPLVAGERGRLAQVYGVGVADDGGLLRLTEHLPQKHRLHPAAADEVGEHVPRPHRGQLVRVSHQHQPGAGPQCPQQGGEERQVHHAHLVHNHRVRLQGLLLRL